MKLINNFIQEKLKIGSKTKVEKIEYKYHPDSYVELTNLIYDRIKENNDNILDLNDIDTSKITDMEGLFAYRHITEIDISNWDVSNVETMGEMFIGCKKLESIGDISHWNINKLRDINYMFYGCENLTNVGDLNIWNISKIRHKENAFSLANKDIIPKWA